MGRATWTAGRRAVGRPRPPCGSACGTRWWARATPPPPVLRARRSRPARGRRRGWSATARPAACPPTRAAPARPARPPAPRASRSRSALRRAPPAPGRAGAAGRRA
eukprot:scaffold67379_cov58-Phaeocystis_antarctica.AAC.1